MIASFADLFRTQAFIAGAWVDADARATLPVHNPATDELIGTVPKMGIHETRRAIEAAETAYSQWRNTTAQDRSRFLKRWHDLILNHLEPLAKIMTLEQGKPLQESRNEILYAASYVEWFAEEARRSYGDTIPAKKSDHRIVTLQQPIGVCAAITPWNFPAAMITRKAAAALAAGCSMVLKPANLTPFSALALAKLAEDAGLPTGLLSIITGDSQSIGAEMTRNLTVRKLSFTGSTEVGRILMAQCADSIKRLSLELGGNAPFIVFDDADLDAAVKGCIESKFRNAGQTCVCANRILVDQKVHAAFTHKLQAAMQELRLGQGFDPTTTLGPVINFEAVKKIQALVDNAVQLGAICHLGGQVKNPESCFYPATLLTQCTVEMQLFHEEIFGPVAAIYSFNGVEEAIQLANQTHLGLSSYLYTQNLSRAWHVAERIEAGMVGINTGLLSNESAPFGGIKQSGIGREGGYQGLQEYMETKYMCLTV